MKLAPGLGPLYHVKSQRIWGCSMGDLMIYHRDQLPEAREVRPQRQGDRKAAVHIRPIQRNENRSVLYTRYDPGLVLERHAHRGDQVIHVIDGDLMVGEFPARKGATIVLDKGTAFGPLVAGESGATILEIFIGANASVPDATDPAGFRTLLEEKGITLLEEHDPTVPPAVV